MVTRTVNGVLNEATNTVHKHETGKSDFQTVCGATYHVPHDNLRMVTAVEAALEAANASKCGQCFEDGVSY